MSAIGTNAASARRIAVHIGLKKSGSATLQTYFNDNAAALRSSGIDYPEVGRGDSKQHHNLQREQRGRKNFLPDRGGIEDFIRYMENSEYNLTVISSEMFESLDTPQVQSFREAIGTAEQSIEIIMVLRNLIDLIPSSYAQKVRYGQKNHDFDRFFAKRMDESRVSYFATAAKWADAFGWANVKVRLLDSRFLRNGDLIDDFLATVGVDPDDPGLRSLPRPGVVNSASGWRVLEAVRALYCRRNPLPSTHRLTTILTHATTLARRKKIEQAAIEAGRSRGWQDDRGLYLTREQAQIVQDLYDESIVALNERLATPLPRPADLASSGFVERPFLPAIAQIPRRDLMSFYQEVADRLEDDPRLVRAARDGGGARRELRVVSASRERPGPGRKRSVEQRVADAGDEVDPLSGRGLGQASRS